MGLGSQEGVRAEVVARVGTGSTPMSGHIPFTPRAKKTLELSLREALQLNHNYIGTEHVLLGLIREGEGVAAQTITAHGADLDSVRQAIIELLHTYTGQRSGQRLLRSLSGVAEAAEGTDLPATPAAEASVTAAVRLAGTKPIGSHHLLLAALDDPNSAAARTLAGLGVDLDQAREALRTVDVTGTSDEQPEERGRAAHDAPGHRHQPDHRGHRPGPHQGRPGRGRSPRRPGGPARHHPW